MAKAEDVVIKTLVVEARDMDERLVTYNLSDVVMRGSNVKDYTIVSFGISMTKPSDRNIKEAIQRKLFPQYYK